MIRRIVQIKPFKPNKIGGNKFCPKQGDFAPKRV